MRNVNTEFDFDEMVRLAKEDPDAYENKREKMIQEVIDNTSPEVKRRMEGLQWQIDQIRSTSANPMQSCLRISQMMWDSVLSDDGLLDHMRQLTDPEQLPKLNRAKESATIINIKTSVDKEKTDS
jgi:uncharacterized protein DUF3135